MSSSTDTRLAISPWPIAAAALALAACAAAAPDSLFGPSRGSDQGSGRPFGSAFAGPAGAAGEDRAAGGTPADALSRGTGFLRLEIRWPKRDFPGFNAQFIPLRTQSIRLTVSDGQGEEVLRETVIRAPGASIATASIQVAAGLGFGIQADAFAERSPTDSSAPIARGNAVNVPVRKGKLTQVPITLTAVNAPAITGLSPPAGGYGTELQVSGKNFGSTPDIAFKMTLGGVAVPATRLSDTFATASVPTGSVGGNVAAVVDGVPTSTTAFFFVITQGLAADIAAIEDTYGPNGLGVLLESWPDKEGFWVGIDSGGPAATTNPANLGQGLEVTLNGDGPAATSSVGPAGQGFGVTIE